MEAYGIRDRNELNDGEVLGAVIRDLREKAGLTQAELEEKSGFAKGAIAKIESGHTPIKARVLIRLEKFLGETLKVIGESEFYEEYCEKRHLPTMRQIQETKAGLKRFLSAESPIEQEVTSEEMEMSLAKLLDGARLLPSPDELVKQIRGVDFGTSSSVSSMRPSDGLSGYEKSIIINRLIKATRDPQARVAAAMGKLNEEGQEKAAERVEELTEIPRYQAPEPSTAPPGAPEGTDTTPAETPPEERIQAITMICPICGKRFPALNDKKENRLCYTCRHKYKDTLSKK